MIIPEYRVRMHIVVHKEHFVKSTICTAQKMNLSIKDFVSKCNQIRTFVWIWSHLLKKSLMKNFIFCTVMISFCLLLPSSSSGNNKIVEIKTRWQTTKTAQKLKFSIKDFSVNVTKSAANGRKKKSEEILNGKLHLRCSES